MAQDILCTLVILDGWGLSYPWGGNAVTMADIPNINKWWRKYPHAELCASGTCVGLPGHEMGNSEVGHISIGAGRVIHQDRLLIDDQIQSGKFYQNEALLQTINNSKSGRLHVVGLVSDGGIHSAYNHIEALEKLIKSLNVGEHSFHMITDGRDSDPTSGLVFANQLERLLSETQGVIETVSGRYFAMDRDNHWDRLKLAYDAIVLGRGITASGVKQAISASYRQGQTDEYIIPTIVSPNYHGINSGDTIIFFNFRQDRIKQLAEALISEQCDFKRVSVPQDLKVLSFVPYHLDLCSGKIISAFEKTNIPNGLAEVISTNKLKQMHIAETEKYAHVTYFFNGGREEPFSGEDRKLISSPNVATYDLKPEMSAEDVADATMDAISSGRYSLIVTNFANADMVGHTGKFQPTIDALQTIDRLLGEIKTTMDRTDGYLIVTADHGNAEEMLGVKTGLEYTEHTSNPIPFLLVNSDLMPVLKLKNIENSKLANIAPTILEILNIPKPGEMLSESLLEKVSQT